MKTTGWPKERHWIFISNNKEILFNKYGTYADVSREFLSNHDENEVFCVAGTAINHLERFDITIMITQVWYFNGSKKGELWR